ncbi:cellulase-like family protein [Aestuariimicrobium ganziense]|uniref:cellulase-like family protein n=1 Tax=Aestuariimicrobium ganziense TaxID=2773677 RepID=UPI0019406C06|nr:cellulase-like family protein [Aestuariimicrobium ganziense]
MFRSHHRAVWAPKSEPPTSTTSKEPDDDPHDHPEKVWHLPPEWTQNTWGAQSPIDVQVMPALPDFIRTAGEHGIRTGLSTWFRQDRDDTRLRISNPDDLGRIWLDTLRQLDMAGVMDHVIYLDLCNEWPLHRWAPFLYGSTDEPEMKRSSERNRQWTADSIGIVKAEYPDLPVTFSVCNQYDDLAEEHVSSLDFLEPHLWMANSSGFYDKVGYHFEPFDPIGYDNVVANAKREYLDKQEHYDNQLWAGIEKLAQWSRDTGKPLVTTECWAIVDYKDWPGLDWDWVNDLNARAVERAAATGRWAGIATSNFAGPQFRGAWRDVAHHQRLTGIIHDAALDADLRDGAVFG